MLSEILFELGTEELPSAAVRQLGEAFFSHLSMALVSRGLLSSQEEQARCLATPRRIAIQMCVHAKEPSQNIERQGPAYQVGMNEHNEPTQALLGFARSCGVEVQALQVKETEKGKWFVYKQTVEGQEIKQLISGLVQEAIDALPLPKPMRWGVGDEAFARPVHWAVLMVDQEVVEMSVFGCKTGRLSYGHRFHHPQAVELSHASEYLDLLKKAYVVVDFEERKQRVVHEVGQAALSVDGIASMPPELLDEVTSIVEWPVGLCVPFDPTFLQNVPHEALIAAMHVHQKCFPVYKDQQLVPHFITVSNIQSREPDSVIRGNGRVMRARLTDAAFFYAQDKSLSLSVYVEKTTRVVFQEKLGSLYDKSRRLIPLMGLLAEMLQLNLKDAERAAVLCKADLMTSMVSEFPELEGLMGYYYALHEGESESVAVALKEQYWPRFSKDVLPGTVLGKILSLADRIDTLVGIFAIGIRPTSTKDPFKLRRHAVAVIRILTSLSTNKPLYLSKLIEVAAQGYTELKVEPKQLESLHEFILDRLPTVYSEIHVGLIQAILQQQNDCLFDFDQRLSALKKFFEREESQALSAACKRVERLLQTVQIDKDALLVDKKRLEFEVENALLAQIEFLEVKVRDYLSPQVMPTTSEYDAVLSALADFRQTVDVFFEQVMVMVDDSLLRTNRLNLLARLYQLFQIVGDISKLY